MAAIIKHNPRKVGQSLNLKLMACALFEVVPFVRSFVRSFRFFRFHAVDSRVDVHYVSDTIHEVRRRKTKTKHARTAQQPLSPPDPSEGHLLFFLWVHMFC